MRRRRGDDRARQHATRADQQNREWQIVHVKFEI
jgi:hypothetical protein